MEIELILYYCDAIPIVRTRFIASFTHVDDSSRKFPIVRTRFIASIYIGHDESCPYTHLKKIPHGSKCRAEINQMNQIK